MKCAPHYKIQCRSALMIWVILEIKHSDGQTRYPYYVFRFCPSSSKKTKKVNKVTALQYTDSESAGFQMLRNQRQLWRKITSANPIGFRKPMRLPCYKLSIINRIKSRDQCWTIITLCVRNMSRHISKAAGFTVILNSFCSCFCLSFQPSHFTE
jgi:hypothetical protein